MANISVYTTSSNFGFLPNDTSQYGDWLSQYSNPGITIYQDQYNVISGLMSIASSLNSYLYYYGYNYLNFVGVNDLRLIAGSYTVDYIGNFSSASSYVSQINLYNAATGTSATESGNFYYSGYPVLAALNYGSTLTSATDLIPNPASLSSNISDVVLLDAVWNGSYWSGNVNAYSEAISDTTNNEIVQVNLLENPTAISFTTASPIYAGFLNLATPVVNGVGVQVSNYSTGIVTDSILATGVSFSGSSVAATQAISAEVVGNDVVTLDGSGILDVIPMLDVASVESVQVIGQAQSITNNLDRLETLGDAGKLTSVNISDGGNIIVSGSQLISDHIVLNDIVGTTSLVVQSTVSVATAVDTDSAILAKLASGLSVEDSSVDVAGSLDILNTIKNISNIRLTDFNPMNITYDQLISDAPALAKIQGAYWLAVNDVPKQDVATVERNPHVVSVACFVARTRIATARGDVPVEALAAGDSLPTRFAGTSRIVWVGHRRVDCRHHPRPWDVWPVHVRPGAFGAGQPCHDLWLSPDHAVLAGGVLIPVRYLINGATVLQEPADSADYWHVELERHDVLLAEGLPCESYLDTGNRGAFANGGAAVQMHPDFALQVWQAEACAPLVRCGARLANVRRRLLRRAQSLGFELVDDADLQLLVDGSPLYPEAVDGMRYRFSVRRKARDIRLRSRSGVPAHVSASAKDHRRLGVMISRLSLLRPFQWQELPVADQNGAGFHALETDGGRQWRWTDGDAALTLSPEMLRDGVLLLYVDVLAAQRAWRAAESAAHLIRHSNRQ